MGDRACHGTWQRMSINMGLPIGRRDYLGQNESVIEDYPNWEDRALVEPF